MEKAGSFRARFGDHFGGCTDAMSSVASFNGFGHEAKVLSNVVNPFTNIITRKFTHIQTDNAGDDKGMRILVPKSVHSFVNRRTFNFAAKAELKLIS